MTAGEYNECVKQHADDVYRFAWKSLRSEEDARDVVQHAFEILWRNLHQVSCDKCKSYLFTVAHRKCIDFYRTNKVTADIDKLDFNNYVQNHDHSGLKKALETALNQLPLEQKNLVLLKDVEGYNYEEIAQITELSLSQVKVYLFRARKQLQKILEVYQYKV